MLQMSVCLSFPSSYIILLGNSFSNQIGEAGANSLAGVLPQCASLAHLNVNEDGIQR
jgi:hypothetical protein